MDAKSEVFIFPAGFSTSMPDVLLRNHTVFADTTGNVWFRHSFVQPSCRMGLSLFHFFQPLFRVAVFRVEYVANSVPRVEAIARTSHQSDATHLEANATYSRYCWYFFLPRSMYLFESISPSKQLTRASFPNFAGVIGIVLTTDGTALQRYGPCGDIEPCPL